MIEYKEIRDVHLEISTLCNASCPLCPRNFHGYQHNDGYPELNMTLEKVKKIFTNEFLNQLTSIRINGNFGDMIMNPQAADIVEYFKQGRDNLHVSISTNGSARDKSFWIRLAKLNSNVTFCLDGLEDTHNLYRRNTSWKTIIKNASTFISAGGNATWKFIKFQHNEHQIEDCKKLSTALGFGKFELVNHGRDTGPVFDKDGNHLYNLGNYQGRTDFQTLFFKKKTDLILLEDIVPNKTPSTRVYCKAKMMKSIYISATGEVFPCCWTGFYPSTYGKGEYHQAINEQLSSIISENNALHHGIETCITWFNNVEQRWKLEKYEHGRLVVCDDVCGSN